MKLHAKIQKWGNSLGLRISGPIKTIPKFEENMLVTVDISEKGIYVYPRQKKLSARELLPFTEEDLLKGMTPYLAHADEIADFKYLPEELDI